MPIFPLLAFLSWDWLTDHPWFFFIIGIVFAAVLLFFDHGETWEDIKTKKGTDRIRAIIKLTALWGLMLITILSGIGAILAADEQGEQIADLQSRIGPRHLTAKQHDALLAELSKNPKGIIYVVPSMMTDKEEILPYAQELLNVIHESGFDARVNIVDTKANTELINVLSWPHSGVFVEVFDKNKPPSQSKVLRDCLREAGINALEYDDDPDAFDKIEKDSVILGVGTK